MNKKIKIGIVGYGNLGKGVELAINQNPDMVLKGIFTRRDPASIGTNSNKLINISNVLDYKDKIDVMILCGGSLQDLDEQGPMLANHFNTVDSFDNHGRIPEYFEKINKVARKSKKLSLISTGWDPGLFSLNRLLGQSVLPEGKDYTFWGAGLSQGHSDAIRKVQGVEYGVQYTLPMEDILEKVRAFEEIDLPVNQMHKRVCYVVPEDKADLNKIKNEIKTMPNYFADYHTSVNFISEEEFFANHSDSPHGGHVIRNGRTGSGYKHTMEFSLKLENNPQFTASVIVAFARAVYRMSQNHMIGAITVFDVPLGLLSKKTPEDLRRELL